MMMRMMGMMVMIILVFEYEVLKHGVVKCWKLGQRLDELQTIFPLAVQD